MQPSTSIIEQRQGRAGHSRALRKNSVQSSWEHTRSRGGHELLQGFYCPLLRREIVQKRMRKGTLVAQSWGFDKWCSSCQEFWPADTEFFFPSKSAPDGLFYCCKACYVEMRATADQRRRES